MQCDVTCTSSVFVSNLNIETNFFQKFKKYTLTLKISKIKNYINYVNTQL